MAKHGNRSITSKSGSADVLEQLGINIYLPIERLGEVFDQTGIVFLFAQHMHPNMRFVIQVRRQLEIPTMMNLIGPLTNPVPLKTQLLGTNRRDLIEQTAQTLKNLGRERAIVISGPDGMDEAALSGENSYALLENGEISLKSFTPDELGMPPISLAEIRGGDAAENAQILQKVLRNEASPFLEIAALNAGLGFLAAGKTADLPSGIALARELLESGAAYQKLQQLQEIQS
jgi:anthranilate phosphoribosyltransferase